MFSANIWQEKILNEFHCSKWEYYKSTFCYHQFFRFDNSEKVKAFSSTTKQSLYFTWLRSNICTFSHEKSCLFIKLWEERIAFSHYIVKLVPFKLNTRRCKLIKFFDKGYFKPFFNLPCFSLKNFFINFF